MMPTYGSDLRSIIFSPNAEDFLDEIIEDAIKDASETWMPEVIIENVKTDRDLENNPYTASIEVTFSISIIPDSTQTINITVEV